ncbi:polysaccharide deacetylase family protein [Streptacidiphilus jiangxiensis]|uniref:Polysaccharide deacetylase n=1 Tax=Streptacidiphilus jiangxiensis TaxID=235985 RepID=A0A1H7XKG7_STRJI|nr:polysaccharide deacetylase family protein [Streptacidiphilus jiangxiensis]SEM33657.1 Polysaccharide deacetylase [Streptacidiphilus jiangxiensis]
MSPQVVHNVSFHGVGAPGPEREPGEHDYWVSRDSFLRILDACAARPEVRLSFDDGNESDVAIALPALVERGLTADFFVIAGRIDTPGNVSAEGVRALVAAGMGVGTHGLGHRAWPDVPDTELRAELTDARTAIAETAGRPVDSAACPFGAYDRRILGRLRALGYRRVYTSDRRPAAGEAWLQARFSVLATDTVDSFRTAVFAHRGPARRLRDTAVGAVKRWR